MVKKIVVKGRRPCSHVRFMKTKKGYKQIRINPGIKKRVVPKKRTRKMAWDVKKAKDSGAVVKMMSPDEYLEKTQLPKDLWTNPIYEKYYDNETGKSEPISKLSDYIKSKDKKVTIPYYGDGKWDHEGRHRALAAKKAGIKKIPVDIPLPVERRTALGRKFADKTFKDHGEGYKQEWVRRFEEGRPQIRMDDVRNLEEEGLSKRRRIKEFPVVKVHTKDNYHTARKLGDEKYIREARKYVPKWKLDSWDIDYAYEKGD